MFYTCVQRFDVTGNLEKFCKILTAKQALSVGRNNSLSSPPMRPLFSTAHQGGYGQLCAFVTVVIGGIDFAGGGDNGAGVDVTGVQDGMGDVRPCLDSQIGDCRITVEHCSDFVFI
jgi:hypothetical protein